MKKAKHPNTHEKQSNAWDKIQVRNGKLVGMLTDDLASDSLPKLGGGTKSTKLDTAGTIGAPKVYKKPATKFRRSGG